jgi:hypothetical protein
MRKLWSVNAWTRRAAWLGLLFLAGIATASADPGARDARCVVYPNGEEHPSAVVDCTYSSRDDFIHLRREDGVEYELRPVDTQHGHFVDQDGQSVYREHGLGDAGVIFRSPAEAVFVYWNPADAPGGTGAASSTMPYSAIDYDATALLPCSFGSPSLDDYCAAGIRRQGPDAATVQVMKPDGVERTFQFIDDELTSPDGGDVTWERPKGDWYIRVDGYENYEVPQSVVSGSREGSM